MIKREEVENLARISGRPSRYQEGVVLYIGGATRIRHDGRRAWNPTKGSILNHKP